VGAASTQSQERSFNLFGERTYLADIGAHENEAIRPSVLPNGSIAGTPEIYHAGMRRFRIQISQIGDEALGKILIEEEPQCRSRPASGPGKTRQPPLAIRGERKASTDVFPFQLREVGKDLVFGHPPRQVGKHIPDGDPSVPYRGLSEANFGLQYDAFTVIHE